MTPSPSTPSPYQPPLTLQTIQHVALSSKSYRIFGLADEAWLNARNDLKKQRRLVVGRKSSHDGSDNNNNKNDVGNVDNDNTNGGGKEDNTNNNEEEREEMMEICEAIRTALQEDAGGFGTAGFHLEKVKNVQLSSTNSAMFTCTLHPNDPSPPPPDDEDEEEDDDDTDGYVELTPQKLIEAHHKMNKSDVLLGNDLYYSKLFDHHNNNGPKNQDDNEEGGRFKLRIVISKANEGVICKKFHDGLFDLSNDLLAAASTNTTTTTTTSNNDNNNDNSHDGYGGGGITEDMVEGNETLLRLKQQVLDARIVNTTTTTTSNGDGDDDDSSSSSSSSSSSGGKNQTQSRPILGYYVTIMLCEPHIQKDDIVIPPPSYLDKCDVINFKPVPYPYDDTICYNGSGGGGGKEDKEGGGGVFSNGKNNICTSLQFINPGPWERANLQAFELIALDVKKALVRVEFPMFPEGCREKTFKEVYQLNARLKSGSYATVCRGTHRATGKKVAIKCVLRQDLPPNDDAAIYDEVLILSTLRHRYICPLIDFFEEVECYFLVMELMSGGDLFDRIGKRKSYTENDARSLCRKLLESVRYCHENSVAHCDMKPKNLLLADDDDDVEIKLSDFGFATRVYEPRSVTKQCGTPFFVAPEVLMRSPYDQQSDMWSVGVIMYLLLGGDLPFMGRTQKELFRSIVLGKYDFPEESWSHVSDEAKDLVKKLLVTDPSERLTSRAAIQSSWMRQRGNLLARNNLQYTSCRLKTFNARMKLRSSMLAVTAITRLRLSISNPSQFASDRSMSSLGSQRSVGESAPKRFPSFLDIPDENNNDAEQK